jgi:hypothetical protein
MTTSARSVALALTATLALASTSGAQEPATPVDNAQEHDWEEELWAEPPALLGYYETWSAIRLRELRWAAARGDRWALKEYVRRHFLPGQTDTGEQPFVESLLDDARVGDLNYWSYLSLGSEHSSVMMRSAATPERWLQVGVHVEEQPPYRVKEIQLEPATAEDAPGDLETFPEDQLPRRLELLAEAPCSRSTRTAATSWSCCRTSRAVRGPWERCSATC